MSVLFTPTEQEWEVIRRFIDVVKNGDGLALVVPPRMRQRLEELGGKLPPGEAETSYSFDGSPDYAFDVVCGDPDSREWLEGVTPAKFAEAFEDLELSTPLEAAAAAAGFTATWMALPGCGR